MSQVFEYSAHIHNDIFIVWLKAVNRYIQLKEPAFRVMEQWAQGNDINSVAGLCAERYGLPYNEALRFTKEITSEINALLASENNISQSQVTGQTYLPLETPFSKRCYRINQKSVCFKFETKELEYFFHPMFSYFEIDFKEDEAVAVFELSQTGKEYIFQLNGTGLKTFPENKPEEFQGAVCLELINCIHNKKINEWMGVIHASAVTDGHNTLIFVAPAGSGKSSIAALMLAGGYGVLSDDFVPVALDEPEIYSFPAAISVKSTSLAFMKEHFPSLPDPHPGSQDASMIYETYMPLPDHSVYSDSVKAKAIIFVQYDKKVKYKLSRVPNTKAMNDFLHQAWIANNSAAAKRFMEWYFSLPVYTLRYSDNSMVVNEMEKLFSK